MHLKLYPYVQYLEKENRSHFNELLRAYRLYYGQNITSFQAHQYYRANTVQQEGSHRNLVSSIVDTVVNKIAGGSEPAVEYYTIGGDWKQQRQARKLNKFLQGLFYQTDAYSLGADVCRDGALCGDGIFHVFEKDDKVAIERVNAHEIFYDLAEAKFGRPRQIFRYGESTKSALAKLIPSKANEIYKASPLKDGMQSSDFSEHLVRWWEVHILPSGKDSNDGYRAVILQDSTLVFESYDKPFFPYAIYQYNRPALGPYGISVTSRLIRSQVYVNRLLKLIDRSLVALAVPRVWGGPGFNPDHYTQSIGAVLKGVQEPKLLTQQIMPAEVYQHLADVIQSAKEDVGVNEMAIAAQKPAGITAAIAMETLNDSQSARLALPNIGYQKVYVDLAKIAISVMKDIAKKNDGSYVVEFRKAGGFSRVDWKELDVDDESFTLQANPIANLSNKITGKLQLLSTLQAAGVISPYEMPRLIKNPDLDQFIDGHQAAEDLIYQKIDRILDDGIYEAPDDFEDLQLSVKLFTEAWNKAVFDGAPDPAIRLLGQYIKQLQQKLAPPPQIAPPMAGPAQGTPNIQPSMAPASPLPAQLQSH